MNNNSPNIHNNGVPYFSNILEINPSFSELLYFTNALCSKARVFTFEEYLDNLYSVRVKSYLRSAPAIYSSTFDSFGDKNEVKLDKLVGNLPGPNVLIVHNILDIEFVSRIYHVYKPDILIFKELSFLNIFKSRILPDQRFCDYIDIIPHRFLNLQMSIVGNQFGLYAFNQACNQLDNHYRRFVNSKEISIDISNALPRVGYYELEHDKTHDWAWSGPTNSAHFYIPFLKTRGVKITIFFYHAIFPISPDNIQILINGDLMNAKYFANDLKIEMHLNPYDKSIGLHTEIRYSRGMLIDDHSRRIGAAVHKVRIEDVI